MNDLYGATAAVLHGVADLTRLSTRSDERRHIVVVQFLQLHRQSRTNTRCILDKVASLELMSPGATTDGVTLFFYKKN